MTRQLLAEGDKIGGRSCETSEISMADGIWTDHNAKGEERKEDQTVPLRIRHRGKRPVNRIGKSFSNGDSDCNAIQTAKLSDSLQDDVSVVHAPGGVKPDFLLARQMVVHRRCC